MLIALQDLQILPSFLIGFSLEYISKLYPYSHHKVVEDPKICVVTSSPVNIMILQIITFIVIISELDYFLHYVEQELKKIP